MIRGLYTSAVAMRTQMHRMDVTTNNLANVNTTGFKKDTSITQSFPEQLAFRLNDPSIIVGRADEIGKMSQGLLVQNIYTNFSQGSLENTGNTLDLAIDGGGFFSVTYNGATAYTRNGNFTLTDDRYLTTADGYRVQGTNGDIQFERDGMISIGSAGEVYLNDEYVDTLAMVSFEDSSRMRKMGTNLLQPIANTPEAPFSGEVIQGFIESSNVNTVQEMVDMITISRAYEASQRMVSIQDTTLGKAVNDIASR